MSLAGLWSFIVTCVGLAIIVGLIFLIIEMLQVDAGFKKIARFVVGGAALLMFLIAVGAVLGIGGSPLALKVTPTSIIEFGIGALILLLVLWIIYKVVDRFGFWPTEIKFLISTIALIIVLVLAEKALTGGLGMLPNIGGGQRSETLGPHIGYNIPPPKTQVVR